MTNAGRERVQASKAGCNLNHPLQRVAARSWRKSIAGSSRVVLIGGPPWSCRSREQTAVAPIKSKGWSDAAGTLRLLVRPL